MIPIVKIYHFIIWLLNYYFIFTGERQLIAVSKIDKYEKEGKYYCNCDGYYYITINSYVGFLRINDK